MFDSLWLHRLQLARFPCPSLSSGVCSNSYPLSRWCYLTVSSFVAAFSFCFPSFPASGSFPMTWLFTSGGQSIGALASALPVKSQWLISFTIDCFDLAVQGTLKSLLQHRNSKASILCYSAYFMVHLSHPYMTTGKTSSFLTIWTFVGKVMSLLFNMLSRFVIAFLPRSKHHLISYLQSPSAVILEPKKRKSVTFSSFSCEMMGPYGMILVFWILSFKPAFFLLPFHLRQEAL